MEFECKGFFVDRSSDGMVDVRVLGKEDAEVLLSLGLLLAADGLQH